jgi:hypothetical protein
MATEQEQINELKVELADSVEKRRAVDAALKAVISYIEENNTNAMSTLKNYVGNTNYSAVEKDIAKQMIKTPK